ncbi:hypothetical protein [Streptomyces sp. NBC_00203]|uniref:hypothetical protein n=1 Tax=Streptomyces sp. NBC_00203 TaxID=2975680 RepID=UPI00324D662D
MTDGPPRAGLTARFDPRSVAVVGTSAHGVLAQGGHSLRGIEARAVRQQSR